MRVNYKVISHRGGSSPCGFATNRATGLLLSLHAPFEVRDITHELDFCQSLVGARLADFPRSSDPLLNTQGRKGPQSIDSVENTAEWKSWYPPDLKEATILLSRARRTGPGPQMELILREDDESHECVNGGTV